MSVEAIAIALHHSKAKGTAKLVLLGIANHDGDGGAWPSKSTLAKYANVDQRNVDRAIKTLVSLAEIRVGVSAGGRSNTPDYLRPNLYHFLVECPSYCDRSRQHRDTRKGARYVPRYLDVAEDASPPAPAPPDGGSAAPPPAQAPGDPTAVAPPELNKEPATNLSPALDVVADARADEKERSAHVSQSPSQPSTWPAAEPSRDLDTLARICPRTGSVHVFPLGGGWCTNCGQARDDGALQDRHGNPLRQAVSA